MLKAIKDRIIIKLDESVKNTIICVNDNAYRNSGVVLDIGEQVKSVDIGDHIIFHLFDELELPETDLVVIREKSVLAKFE